MSAPVLGRDTELARIGAALSTAPGGALIEGESGAGKSALARAVFDAEPGPKHWIEPDRVLAEQPFGALALLLCADPGDEADPFIRLDRAFDITGRARPLVVVDNAHHLDAASAEALAHYASIGAIRPLIAARLMPALPPTLTELAYSFELERLRLGPLAADAVQAIIADRFDGVVAGHVTDVLTVLSDGNPGVLLALAEAALRRELLVRYDGVWTLRGTHLSIPEIAAELAASTPDDPITPVREALEPVALAGRLPVAALLAAGRGEQTDALVSSGILALDPVAEPTVHIAQPLVAEVIRTIVPPHARRRLREEFAPHLETPPASAPEAEAWTRWSLDSGARLPEEYRRDVARAAHGRGHFTLATQVLETVDAADPGTALALAHLCCDVDRPLEALDLVSSRRAELTGTEALLHAAITVLRSELLLCEPSLTLGEHLSDWSERLRATAGGPWADLAADVLVDIAAMYIDIPDLPALDAGAVGADRAEMPRLLRALLELCTAFRALKACDLEHAATLFDRMDVDGWACFRLPGFVWSLRAESLSRLGRFAELEAALADRREGDLDAPVSGLGELDVICARRALAEGDHEAALARFRAAVVVLEEHDSSQMLPSALAAAAYASALHGDEAQVREYARRFERHPCTGPCRLWLLARAELDVALSVVDRVPASAADLLRLADRARTHGCQDSECRILLLAAGCGAIDDTARMREFADRTDPAALLLARLGSALEAGESQPLEDLAAELWATHPLTAIACRRVSRGLDPVPDPADLTDPALTTSVPADERALASLSRRELEVRELVLAGLTNAEIAVALQLSVRTVEGHVYRLLRKLGLRKRSELSIFAGPTGS